MAEEGLGAPCKGGQESQPTVATRAGHRITKPSRCMQMTKVSTEDWKSDASERLKMEELKMLFQELRVQ